MRGCGGGQGGAALGRVGLGLERGRSALRGPQPPGQGPGAPAPGGSRAHGVEAPSNPPQEGPGGLLSTWLWELGALTPPPRPPCAGMSFVCACVYSVKGWVRDLESQPCEEMGVGGSLVLPQDNRMALGPETIGPGRGQVLGWGRKRTT